MIKGLSDTDDNYIIAVTALQDRYVDPVKQTKILLQKFFNLPSPHNNAKELHKFLTEYRKVREQMRHDIETVFKFTLIINMFHVPFT